MSIQESLKSKLKPVADKLDLFPYLNDALVLGGFIGLSYIGIAITNASPESSHFYWAVIIPLLFGLISTLTLWVQLRSDPKSWALALRRQIFHWAGLFVAVQITYILVHLGRLSYESVSFIVLLLLSFAVFMQGVYVDWRYYIVCLFLALSLIIAIYVTAYLWIILILGAVILITSLWFVKKFNKKTDT